MMVDLEAIKAQLDHTVGTLESEAKLLALYIKDFRSELDASDQRRAGLTMMRANRLALSMIPMLKDVVRYTVILKARSRARRQK